ncbi:MAG TPA: hypothetical protein VND91_09455 [Candidatus Saccharimonadia bacterium]|nr:hypothetical protein [Candidatus Saccharimonadia bacterium]
MRLAGSPIAVLGDSAVLRETSIFTLRVNGMAGKAKRKSEAAREPHTTRTDSAGQVVTEAGTPTRNRVARNG